MRLLSSGPEDWPVLLALSKPAAVTAVVIMALAIIGVVEVARQWLVRSLVRRNRGQARSELDDTELLQAADRRLRERLHAALADTGVTLRLVEPAG